VLAITGMMMRLHYTHAGHWPETYVSLWFIVQGDVPAVSVVTATLVVGGQVCGAWANRWRLLLGRCEKEVIKAQDILYNGARTETRNVGNFRQRHGIQLWRQRGRGWRIIVGGGGYGLNDFQFYDGKRRGFESYF